MPLAHITVIRHICQLDPFSGMFFDIFQCFGHDKIVGLAIVQYGILLFFPGRFLRLSLFHRKQFQLLRHVLNSFVQLIHLGWLQQEGRHPEPDSFLRICKFTIPRKNRYLHVRKF